MYLCYNIEIQSRHNLLSQSSEHGRIIVTSSRMEVSYKRGVLKNLTKFTRKHLCRSLFLIRVAVWKPATLLKIRLVVFFFFFQFREIIRKFYFVEHLANDIAYAIEFIPEEKTFRKKFQKIFSTTAFFENNIHPPLPNAN